MNYRQFDKLNQEQMMWILIELTNRGYTKEDARELLFNGKWRIVLRDIREEILNIDKDK